MTYNQFAEVYDALMQEAPYDDWVALTEFLLNKDSVSKNASILDLGCGTGEIAIRLSHLGYHVTGVDNSSDMLSIAQQKAMDTQEQITWIRQDIRELEGFRDLDACISYCDVMNYITDLEDISEVCKRAASILRKDGVFIFDVHDAGYAKNELAGQTFADVTEDIAYIWECDEGDKEGHLFHDITFFQKIDGDRYEKFSELHEQQVYPLEVYETALKNAGFREILFFNDFHVENDLSSENRVRNFIYAKK